MGGKITIDSATLMNKGLELIEAHHLFGTPYERIDVVVHPQSIVHALVAAVRRRDARAPRLSRTCASRSPTRCTTPSASTCRSRRCDLAEVGALTFEPVDDDAFPCLRLAREAAAAGGTAPCVLNAANEVAVHAFLDGRLRFLGIAGGDRGARSSALPAPSRCARSSRCYEADARGARGVARRAGRRSAARMSWLARLRSASPR